MVCGGGWDPPNGVDTSDCNRLGPNGWEMIANLQEAKSFTAAANQDMDSFIVAGGSYYIWIAIHILGL